MKYRKIQLVFVLAAFSILMCVPARGQTTVNMPNSVTVSATATDALNKWLAAQVTSTPTTLASAYTAGGVTLTLASGVGIGVNDLVKVDSEVFLVTAKNGAVMTVTGAQLGTSAANHASAASVSLLRYRSFRQFFLAVLNDTMGRIMEDTGTAKDAYATAVQGAKATLDGQKATAVQ